MVYCIRVRQRALRMGIWEENSWQALGSAVFIVYNHHNTMVVSDE